MRRSTFVFAVIAVTLLIVVASSGAGAGALATPGPDPTIPVPTGAAPALSPTAAGQASPSPGTSPGAAASLSPGSVEPLTTLLDVLEVAPEHRAGYDRDLFVHWIDADGDGCNTRREVLIAEALVAPVVGAGCSLTGGRWVSLYDGRTFTNIADLQIDHLVALAEAWDSGAWAWTAARREAFANDLGEPWELIAVSSNANEAKSDADPADWLPPAAAAECPFLSAWIATKVRWNLTVDPREREALARDLADCPGVEVAYDPVR